MKEFVIRDDVSKIDNILGLIEHVKNIERKNGLSEEEIVKKYTQKDCRCLVSLIQQFFPETKSIMFLLDEESMHNVAGLDIKTSGFQDMVYFDINGVRNHTDVCVFMFESFGVGRELLSFEVPRDNIQNDISQKVMDTVSFESIEPQKQ